MTMGKNYQTLASLKEENDHKNIRNTKTTHDRKGNTHPKKPTMILGGPEG